jgi:hypothetical protein
VRVAHRVHAGDPVVLDDELRAITATPEQAGGYARGTYGGVVPSVPYSPAAGLDVDACRRVVTGGPAVSLRPRSRPRSSAVVQEARPSWSCLPQERR